MREERSAREVLVGQSRATRDWRGRAGSSVDIGGDCNLEGLAKAARSWEFCALRVPQAQSEKDCSRAVRLLRSAAI